jgi:hypothetical protein
MASCIVAFTVYNVLTATMRDYWKNLLEVPAENDRNSTKRSVGFSNILQRSVNCIEDMAKSHWRLIPYNEVCRAK